MPWPIGVLLFVGTTALIVKAIADRKAHYDEPMNEWDGHFDHMSQPNWQRDKQLKDRTR